jgi:hypothetical protein
LSFGPSLNVRITPRHENLNLLFPFSQKLRELFDQLSALVGNMPSDGSKAGVLQNAIGAGNRADTKA